MVLHGTTASLGIHTYRFYIYNSYICRYAVHIDKISQRMPLPLHYSLEFISMLGSSV